jgi:hypothetical protein
MEKTMFRKLLPILLLCLFPAASFADKFTKLERVGETIPIPYELTLLEVGQAIIDGSIKRGWEPKKIRDGVIEDTLRIRSHVAVVHVIYDAKSFRIEYANSTNLLDTFASNDALVFQGQYSPQNISNTLNRAESEEQRIHKNYYVWVDNLKTYIMTALADSQRTSEMKSGEKPKDSISGKLRELEALHKDGLITDSEYKAKRTKLLEQL